MAATPNYVARIRRPDRSQLESTTYQQVDLRDGLVELGLEYLSQRGDSQRRQDADEDKDELVNNHDCLPRCAPVLWTCQSVERDGKIAETRKSSRGGHLGYW